MSTIKIRYFDCCVDRACDQQKTGVVLCVVRFSDRSHAALAACNGSALPRCSTLVLNYRGRVVAQYYLTYIIV